MTGTSTQHIVVMGVSGCGKTTVGEGLAAALGWPFDEGDQFHPPANIAKMAAHTPLTDEDRWPWLRTLADRIAAHERAGRSSILSCSALRRSYRDLLRTGAPRVRFLHLHGDRKRPGRTARRAHRPLLPRRPPGLAVRHPGAARAG